jgi:TorA maturation chaperone TorD/NAD-dependent dihydropyrimidine dehydrogenase PreA subunit
MQAKTARERSRTYAELARAFSEAEPGLEQEFTRLFLGPGRPIAHPYESVHREGRMMGDTTLDVIRCLAEEGLTPNGQMLPDHLSIELAFMAHLASREARAWDERDERAAWDYVAREESFLREHLVAWLPQFCRRILAGRPHAHYAALAQRTAALVTEDVDRLQDWLGCVSEAAVPLTIERDLWSVTVGPGCTLCGICEQVCQPGALQRLRDKERGVLRLRFEAALCDGCAGCEHWCPEKIILVDRIQDAEQPAVRELACSAISACRRCGQPYAPATMIQKVQAEMAPDNEALARWLALCQGCRAQAVPLRMTSPGAAPSTEALT